jgi:hypothetical protein
MKTMFWRGYIMTGGKNDGDIAIPVGATCLYYRSSKGEWNIADYVALSQSLLTDPKNYDIIQGVELFHYLSGRFGNALDTTLPV